jgi:hypothetical protein
MKRVALCLPLFLALTALAHADVIHLNNGRTMEGKVLKAHRGMVTLKVPGGTLVIPQSTVKRIEKRKTPQEEYGERARRTDMTNPRALDTLAHWASSRGLGEQAQNLRAQARGIRLQQRVDGVRDSRFAQDYLEVFRWAKGQGYSKEVQRWLLDKALELEPEHPGAAGALSRIVQAEEARALAKREREAIPAKEPQEDRDGKELDELRSQLEKQKQVSADLRERLDTLERDDAQRRRSAIVRRRRRRARGYGADLFTIQNHVVVRRRRNCPPNANEQPQTQELPPAPPPPVHIPTRR